MLYLLTVVAERFRARKYRNGQSVPVVPVGAAPVRFVHYPDGSAYLRALANARALPEYAGA